MSSENMAVLYISIRWMPFPGSTPDKADPLFALVIAPGFCLHHIKVADEDPTQLGAVYKFNHI